jgi:PHD/YefM family antitoxin component YafN of YafNO toxin-antitoxin module
LRSGDLELVVLPKAEYEALLDTLDNLRNIRDSIESLKEYRAGKRISFDDYDSRRNQKRISH